MTKQIEAAQKNVENAKNKLNQDQRRINKLLGDYDVAIDQIKTDPSTFDMGEKDSLSLKGLTIEQMDQEMKALFERIAEASLNEKRARLVLAQAELSFAIEATPHDEEQILQLSRNFNVAQRDLAEQKTELEEVKEIAEPTGVVEAAKLAISQAQAAIAELHRPKNIYISERYKLAIVWLTTLSIPLIGKTIVENGAEILLEANLELDDSPIELDWPAHLKLELGLNNRIENIDTQLLLQDLRNKLKLSRSFQNYLNFFNLIKEILSQGVKDSAELIAGVTDLVGALNPKKSGDLDILKAINLLIVELVNLNYCPSQVVQAEVSSDPANQATNETIEELSNKFKSEQQWLLFKTIAIATLGIVSGVTTVGIGPAILGGIATLGGVMSFGGGTASMTRIYQGYNVSNAAKAMVNEQQQPEPEPATWPAYR